MGVRELAGVTVIVPARLGSTRLPGKPLADVAGKPLIIRVLDNLGESPGVEVHVATDSPEIARVVESRGHRALITGEASSGTRRVHMAWKALGSPAGWVVNLQGDEPCATMEWVRALVKAAGDGVSTLASPLAPGEATEPSCVKVVVGAGDRALYFSRSVVPWGEGPLFRHGGVYCFTPESLERCVRAGETGLSRRERLEQLAWLEAGVPVSVVIGDWNTLGVDTPADLEKARRLFS
jgi:3-deoxy-manno-octulosonate cytidylyltransferase (CMP-KDO synthetase)